MSRGPVRRLKAVNTELVELYWDIGRMIGERQSGGTWGKAIVQQLAGDLQNEFPGVTGFLASNLWRMKAFFETYRELEKLAPLVREIGWTHNLIILVRCRNPLEREFYLRMTRKFGWSKSVLIHQIKNQSFEKSLLGQTNFDQALTPELRAQAKLAVKDETPSISWNCAKNTASESWSGYWLPESRTFCAQWVAFLLAWGASFGWKLKETSCSARHFKALNTSLTAFATGVWWHG